MEDVLLETSILSDVKKIIGASYAMDAFDTDIILAINTVITFLNQMGIGVQNFTVTGTDETWGDLLKDEQVNLHMVKTWLALNVRLIFDPPASSILMEALKETIKQCEWRMYITENYVGEI